MHFEFQSSIEMADNWEDFGNSKLALYQKLDHDDLIRLQEIFKSSEEQKFSINELENIFEQFNITFSPDKLQSLFLKVLYCCN